MTGRHRAPHPAIEGGWFLYWITISLGIVLGTIAVFVVLLLAAVATV